MPLVPRTGVYKNSDNEEIQNGLQAAFGMLPPEALNKCPNTLVAKMKPSTMRRNFGDAFLIKGSIITHNQFLDEIADFRYLAKIQVKVFRFSFFGDFKNDATSITNVFKTLQI